MPRSRRFGSPTHGEAKLPPGKTLDSFAFDAVPMISRAQVMAICAGDGWLNEIIKLPLLPSNRPSHDADCACHQPYSQPSVNAVVATTMTTSKAPIRA